MIYVVVFEDDPVSGSEVRSRHLPAHIEFLERHADRVRAAGPLREADGGAAGGLWLVEADSPSEVDAIVGADPFWSAGLRKSVRILAWHRVFADGVRLATSPAR